MSFLLTTLHYSSTFGIWTKTTLHGHLFWLDSFDAILLHRCKLSLFIVAVCLALSSHSTPVSQLYAPRCQSCLESSLWFRPYLGTPFRLQTLYPCRRPVIPVTITSTLLIHRVAPQHNPDSHRRRFPNVCPHLVSCQLLSYGYHRSSIRWALCFQSCHGLDERLDTPR